MRTVLVLLLLANLSFFAYTRLDRGGGEGVRLQQQVQPDKVKLLTPQQVAALGPSKVAALADVCAEFGPLSDAERSRSLGDLQPFNLGALVSQRRVEVPNPYWVTLGDFANRPAAERRQTELRVLGIGEATIVDSGGGRFALSLGVFRSDEAAKQHADSLAQRGVRNTSIGQRPQPLAQTMLVVRDPPQPVIARLREMTQQYPGVDVRTGTCPATS